MALGLATAQGFFGGRGLHDSRANGHVARPGPDDGQRDRTFRLRNGLTALVASEFESEGWDAPVRALRARSQL